MTVLCYSSGKIEAILDKGRKTLAEGVNFSVAEGETLALIGETGSGKTIIACSVMKLLPSNVVSDGLRMEFCEKDVTHFKSMRKFLGKEIVYIPQSGHECLNGTGKIKRQLFDSLLRVGTPRAKLERTAAEKLKNVGFENPGEILEKYPHELSGGMAQKVVIALATCSDAKLVIADEPTNGLDENAKREVLGLLTGMFPDAGKILITHDISLAEISDRTVVLCRGKVMESGGADEVLENPKSPYTRALIASSPERGMEETPKLREDKGDCPFYARCKDAGKECLEEPKYKKAGDRKWRCARC